LMDYCLNGINYLNLHEVEECLHEQRELSIHVCLRNIYNSQTRCLRFFLFLSLSLYLFLSFSVSG
jgi:hypothetical protein